MKPTEESGPLDALLREQNGHIDDNGFTARVVKSLPRRRRAWLRSAVLLGATAIGSVLAVCWLPWKDLPPLEISALAAHDFQWWLPWVVVISVAGSLVWTAVAALEWKE